MTRKGRPDRSQAGFTVLELIVLLTMIGVLLGVGIPVLINYLGSGTNSSAQSTAMSALQAADTYYDTNQSSYIGLCPTNNCGSGANPVGFAAQGSGITAVTGNIRSNNAQTASIWTSPDGLKVIVAVLADATNNCWVVIEERRAGRIDLGYAGPFGHLFAHEKPPKTGKTTCNASNAIFVNKVSDVSNSSLTGWPHAS